MRGLTWILALPFISWGSCTRSFELFQPWFPHLYRSWGKWHLKPPLDQKCQHFRYLWIHSVFSFFFHLPPSSYVENNPKVQDTIFACNSAPLSFTCMLMVTSHQNWSNLNLKLQISKRCRRAFLLSFQLHILGFPLHVTLKVSKTSAQRARAFFSSMSRGWGITDHFLSFNMTIFSQVVICLFEALISLRKRIYWTSPFTTLVHRYFPQESMAKGWRGKADIPVLTFPFHCQLLFRAMARRYG